MDRRFEKVARVERVRSHVISAVGESSTSDRRVTVRALRAGPTAPCQNWAGSGSGSMRFDEFGE